MKEDYLKTYHSENIKLQVTIDYFIAFIAMLFRRKYSRSWDLALTIDNLPQNIPIPISPSIKLTESMHNQLICDSFFAKCAKKKKVSKLNIITRFIETCYI